MIKSKHLEKKERNRPKLSDHSTDSIISMVVSSPTLHGEECIINIGAAFSLIMNDAALAQMFERYIMSQRNPMASSELVKTFLQEKKGCIRIQRQVIWEKREKK